MNDLNFKLDNPKQAFVAQMMYVAETTIAVSENWRLQKVNDHYRVSEYGNFKGLFKSLDDALNVIPKYRRESIRKQVKRYSVGGVTAIGRNET